MLPIMLLVYVPLPGFPLGNFMPKITEKKNLNTIKHKNNSSYEFRRKKNLRFLGHKLECIKHLKIKINSNVILCNCAMKQKQKTYLYKT